MTNNATATPELSIKEKRQAAMMEYQQITTRQQLEHALTKLTAKNEMFKKELFENAIQGIYLLNDGKWVTWGRGEPSAFFEHQARERYEKIKVPVVNGVDLQDARYILCEEYFAPYIEKLDMEFDYTGDIKQMSALALYHLIHDFVEDNNIPLSADGQCCIQFPVTVPDGRPEFSPNFIFFYLRESAKKAFISHEAYDVIRLNSRKLDSYQDLVDGKWLK